MTTKTIIEPLDPQPVLVDPKSPGRWCWGPTTPITDMCRGGNAVCSWWNDHNEVDLDEKHCRVERPKKAKVTCVFDGTRWVWVVTYRQK